MVFAVIQWLFVIQGSAKGSQILVDWTEEPLRYT